MVVVSGVQIDLGRRLAAGVTVTSLCACCGGTSLTARWKGGKKGGGGASPPPPPPPTKSDVDVQGQAAKTRDVARKKRGRAATILAGEQERLGGPGGTSKETLGG